jgi:hypothetical protein
MVNFLILSDPPGMPAAGIGPVLAAMDFTASIPNVAKIRPNEGRAP